MFSLACPSSSITHHLYLFIYFFSKTHASFQTHHSLPYFPDADGHKENPTEDERRQTKEGETAGRVRGQPTSGYALNCTDTIEWLETLESEIRKS